MEKNIDMPCANLNNISEDQPPSVCTADLLNLNGQCRCYEFNNNNRHIRTTSDPVVLLQCRNSHYQTTVNETIVALKPTAIKSTLCQRNEQSQKYKEHQTVCDCNSNNSSNKHVVEDEHGADPPAYTPPIVFQPERSPKSCTVNKGAALLVVVLVAIIACLVVALTFFLVSGKSTQNSTNVNGETTAVVVPIPEAVINQTDRCGIIPDGYNPWTRSIQPIPAGGGVFHNNATMRIVGGAPASIRQYPWQKTAETVIGRRINVQSRVMGGTNTKTGKIPWQVGLWVEGRGQTCGGAIILNNWIITAAHCTVTNLKASAWVAYVGFTDTTKKHLLPAQKRKVIQIIQHPKYVDDNTFDYDISLLKLESEVTFSNRIQPACIPPPNITFHNTTNCYVSGWGATENSDTASTSRILQHARIDLFDRQTCENWIGQNLVTRRMICAGKENGESDACQGDSGGPLSCYSIDKDAWVLVGIVSWGIQCGLEQLPGLYTDISYFTNWIWTTISENDQSHSK